MPPLIVVPGADRARAERVADEVGLPLIDRGDAADGTLALLVGARLELGLLGPRAPRPIAVDFLDPELTRRTRRTNGKLPLLARAVGIDRGVHTVIDATAGLGRDAACLAIAGARVTMIERDPVLALMLADGLARAHAAGSEFADRLTLVMTDAHEHLAGLGEGDRPDAIYLDPMFPDRGKSALPGRELQLLRALLGPGGDDVEGLVALAITRVRRRVVMKRAARGPSILRQHDAVFDGSRVRYEVFRPAVERDAE